VYKVTNLEIEKYIDVNLKNRMTQSAIDNGMLFHIINICTDIKDSLINDRIPCSFVKHCLNEDWDRAKAVADRWNKDILNETDFWQIFYNTLKHLLSTFKKLEKKIYQF